MSDKLKEMSSSPQISAKEGERWVLERRGEKCVPYFMKGLFHFWHARGIEGEILGESDVR